MLREHLGQLSACLVCTCGDDVVGILRGITSKRGSPFYPASDLRDGEPFSGAVYVFGAKRADRVKLIYIITGMALACACLPSGSRSASSLAEGAGPARFISR